MSLDSAILQVNKQHPYWWLNMPWNARNISIQGRLDITEMEANQEALVLKGTIGRSEVASLRYEMQSYSISEDDAEWIDEPGAITGRLFWLPEVAGREAGSFLSQYPAQDGYVGASVPAIGRKHSGYNVTFPPNATPPPPLLIGPDQSYDLFVKILSTSAGVPIPERGRRVLQGRMWGWAVPIQP